MNFHFDTPLGVNFIGSPKFIKSLGLVFLIFGLLSSFFAIKMTIDGQRAKNWTTHTAIIQTAKLNTHIDEGRKSYSVNVTYQYKWDRTLYTGNRYRVHDSASSGFDQNSAIVKELLTTQKESGGYPIFVNPKDPKESAVKNIVKVSRSSPAPS